MQMHRAEDEKYFEIKSDLRQEISSLRNKVLDMISTNEELPDIEKLARQEFILDTEEHQRMLAEEDKLIMKVRDDIELSNLATIYTWDLIKRECWNRMVVKGKIVRVSRHNLQVKCLVITLFS